VIDPLVIQPGPSALSLLRPIRGRTLSTEGTLAERGRKRGVVRGRQEGNRREEEPRTPAPRRVRSVILLFSDLVFTTGPSP